MDFYTKKHVNTENTKQQDSKSCVNNDLDSINRIHKNQLIIVEYHRQDLPVLHIPFPSHHHRDK